MNNLSILRKQIFESATIGKDFLSELSKQILSNKITEGEAQFVYEVSDEIIKKTNNSEGLKVWQDLFVKVITSFVLDDERSKGEIDEIEAKWLLDKVTCDKARVELEKALLDNLSKECKNFPTILTGLF